MSSTLKQHLKAISVDGIENGMVIKPPVAPARKAQSWLSSVFGQKYEISILSPWGIVSDAHGRPVVQWYALSSIHINEEQAKKFYRLSNYFNCDRYRAFINPRNAHFVVTRDVMGRYQQDDNPKAPSLFRSKRFLPVSENYEHTTICNLPADDLKAFMDGLASEYELSSGDLAKFRAGKLKYDDHNLIRVAFVDGTFKTLSRDVQSRDGRDNIIVQLTKAFINNRPVEGWKAPTLASAALNASAGYDPI